MAFFKYTSISRLYAGKQALIFLMYFSVRSIGIHYGTSTMTGSAATKYTPVEYSWGTHRVIVELIGNSIVRTVLLGQGTVRWGSPDVYMSLALQPFQQSCSSHGGAVPLPLLQAQDTATHLQSFLQPAPATGSCHQEQRNASCGRCHQSHLGGGWRWIEVLCQFILPARASGTARAPRSLHISHSPGQSSLCSYTEAACRAHLPWNSYLVCALTSFTSTSWVIYTAARIPENRIKIPQYLTLDLCKTASPILLLLIYLFWTSFGILV